jgi:hypothetical protein
MVVCGGPQSIVAMCVSSKDINLHGILSGVLTISKMGMNI